MQRAQHRLLRDVFGETQVVHAQQTNERAMQPAGFVAEKIFH
jgi:hypothetical protein